MVRRLLATAAVAAVIFALATGCRAADTKDITGRYSCEGTNPAGQTYKGTVEITKKGDTYHLAWSIGAGDNYEGLGILEGDTLAVSYYGGATGVVVYKVQKGGKLVGKWAVVEGEGKVYTETLTK
jgi:hypothetical protein